MGFFGFVGFVAGGLRVSGRRASGLRLEMSRALGLWASTLQVRA